MPVHCLTCLVWAQCTCVCVCARAHMCRHIIYATTHIIYIYIYIYTLHTQTYVYMCIAMYVSLCMYAWHGMAWHGMACMHGMYGIYSVHVCMSACAHVCTCALCKHVCMHGWTDVCMHVCMYACMHVCMYVCIFRFRHDGSLYHDMQVLQRAP